MKKTNEEYANLVIKEENDQGFEISSTGYGLESVSKHESEKTTMPADSPSCGGL
jgi:hypothetical protein